MSDLISRAYVLAEYDRQHKGPPGGARKIMEEAPAVDAAPVVHGRWIETQIPANTTGHGGVGQDKKKGWLCSNCRCAFDAELLWCDHYCPNCGAKMDGGERDG